MNVSEALTEQNQRLIRKSQDQRLIRSAVDGAGMSQWEAQVLVGIVNEVYLQDPQQKILRAGQMRCECVSESEGAGKPLSECRLQSVVVTYLEPDDHRVQERYGATALRRQRIVRIAEEAYEQGGLLSQEDLAYILSSDVRTIRRDIKALRENGTVVPTRGQQKDIGPGVTHRELALKHWLDGMEPVEVARRIHHSLTATERYIQHFCRVIFLHRKGFHPLQTAMTVGISSSCTETYIALYRSVADKPEHQQRFAEIDQIGVLHYEAEDEKKGPALPCAKSPSAWRKP